MTNFLNKFQITFSTITLIMILTVKGIYGLSIVSELCELIWKI